MNEPDDFLARWSRRKNEAGKTPAKPPVVSESPAAARPDAVTPSSQATGEAADTQASNSAAKREPAFDPTTLPPIDSIGADTDIGAFLKPGVPSELRHAALRRAWSTDPAIRDFKGLQENDWNFNDPNGIPGFGELSPHTDVKKMLGQLFGESADEPTTSAEVPAPIAQAIPNSPEVSGQSEAIADQEKSDSVRDDQVADVSQSADAGENEMVHRNNDVAMQDKKTTTDAPVARRRTHGGALPH